MKHLLTNSKVTILLIAVICFLFTDVNAQFQIRTYNLHCNNNPGLDNARSIINNFEGGNTIAGFSYAGGCGIGIFDWMFLQLQPNGNQVFANLYGTIAEDKCNSVVQTNVDSTYLLSGFMSDNSNNFIKKATMMNINRAGVFNYSKMIDDTVASTYNQGCIDSAKKNVFAGWKDVYLNINSKRTEKILATKYSPSGIMDWGHIYYTYNGNSPAMSLDEAMSVCYQNSDKSYGVATRTNIFSKKLNVWDIMITKLSVNGGVVWNKIYPFNIPTAHFYPNTEPRKIIPMSDGGFVVVGFTNNHEETANDIIVLRVDAAGNLMWSSCYGNTNFLELGQSIVLDGNNLVITGSVKRSITTPDAYILKIPVTGGPAVWINVWQRNNNLGEGGFDLVRTNTLGNPGYAVTGDAAFNVQDVFFWRTNTNGLIPGGQCNDLLNIERIVNDQYVKDIAMKPRKIKDKYFTPAIQTPQVTNIVRCFESDSNGNGSNESDNNGTNNETVNGINVVDYALDQNYPNPFNPVTKINFDIPVSGNVMLKVFNSAGKEVMTMVNEFKNPGRYEVVFNGSQLSSGVYYYKISASGDGKEFTDIKKMILIK